MAMVHVNDEQLPIELPTSIARLLDSLSLRGGPVAVELNGHLVPGNRHDSIELADGDRLEVVSLTGGG